jgi:hypothetical protein
MTGRPLKPAHCSVHLLTQCVNVRESSAHDLWLPRTGITQHAEGWVIRTESSPIARSTAPLFSLQAWSGASRLDAIAVNIAKLPELLQRELSARNPG